MFNRLHAWHLYPVPEDQAPKAPTFAEAFRFWLKLGFISFGGPTGQIAIMHSEIVEKRRWISEQRFLHALNFCMLLPGPEATQLAAYIGWLLHRTWGGIVAGVLFFLPAAILLWGLSLCYVLFGNLFWVEAAFYGLKPAVVAIIAAALFRIGSRVLHHPALWTIAALAFVGIFLLNLPFPLIVLSAGISGLIASSFKPAWFKAQAPSSENGTRFVVSDDETLSHTRPGWKRSVIVVAVCILLWWTPVVAAGTLLGWTHAITREGTFFSKAAMVTFGGAYAVLEYVSDHAVRNNWVTLGQMTDGLGLAETTPGPLIIVVQFVGFMGGWQNPGSLSPLSAATLGAAITTWCTFVPCFLWIFLGAPYIEQMRENRRLNSALTAVSAAVVGVILNLAVVFAGHVFRSKHAVWNGVDVPAIVVCIVAFLAMWRFKISVPLVVLLAAILGLVLRVIGF
jgi:chromate transporter, chromate ion transporter (CHR) family